MRNMGGKKLSTEVKALGVAIRARGYKRVKMQEWEGVHIYCECPGGTTFARDDIRDLAGGFGIEPASINVCEG